MKKFRQLIREVGEETAMYNHLHMNLLKASLVRSPANGPGRPGRPRTRKPAAGTTVAAAASTTTCASIEQPGRQVLVRHLPMRKDATTQVSDLLLKCAQGRGNDLCFTLAIELVDCVYPDLTYRYLPVGKDVFLEITRKEATMLPSDWGSKKRLYPCKPTRILISSVGVLEFQAAYKVILSTKLPQRDGLALRKIYSEHYEKLLNKSGVFAFCVGFGTPSDAPSFMWSELDNLQPCNFGLGCRAKTCDLWFQPTPQKPDIPSTSAGKETLDNQPLDLSVGRFSPKIDDGLAVCEKCQEAERFVTRKRRRKQGNPRKVPKMEYPVFVADETAYKVQQHLALPF
ncbi:uncharacterized protein [Amphiura filiformis]|uniref:uncharacterized protein n=1 Tax=Amphiura filiformis TaxID=82378 RepID=UPI003B20CFA3